MSDILSSESGSEHDETPHQTNSAPNRRPRNAGPAQAGAAASDTRDSEAGPHRHTSRRDCSSYGNGYQPPLRGSVGAAAAQNLANQGTRTTGGRPGLIPPVPGGSQTTQQSIQRMAANVVQPRAPARAFPNHEMLPVLHEDGPVDHDLFGALETMFKVCGGCADMAENMALVPPPRQFAVHMYSQMAMRQALDALIQQCVRASRTATMEDSSLATNHSNFQFVQVFTDFVKRRSREFLLSKNVKAYSSDLPRNSPATLKGTFTLVMERINAQPRQFKIDYLPRGYIDAEPTAVRTLSKFVRSKLRNGRGKLRDLLLTGVQEAGVDIINHPVPTISALVAMLQAIMLPPLPNNHGGDPANKPRTPSGNQTHLKARIAYLRIQTIIQLLRRGPHESGRQWTNIDAHLRILEARGRAYRGAFSYFQLVLDFDRATFGQSTFRSMDPSIIKLPTDDEVMGKMEQSEALNLAADDIDDEAL